jgi:large subunit ribosomal protein L1
MDAERIAENIESIVNRVESVLDKGKQNLKSIYVTTTMGKSLRVV